MLYMCLCLQILPNNWNNWQYGSLVLVGCAPYSPGISRSKQVSGCFTIGFLCVLVCSDVLLCTLLALFAGHLNRPGEQELLSLMASAISFLSVTWCLQSSCLLWFTFLIVKYNLSPCVWVFFFFFFFPGHNFWAFTGTVLCPSLSFLSLTVGRTVCFNFIASGHLSCLLEPVPGIQGPLLLPLFASLWMTSFLLPAWSYSLKLTLSQASQPSEEFCSSLLHWVWPCAFILLRAVDLPKTKIHLFGS